MRRGFVSITLLASLLGASPALALELYDGSLGTTPDAQGWLAYGDDDFSQNYNSTSGGQTQVDTLAASSARAGYSNHTIFGTIVNPSFPTLDRSGGFVLSFTVKVSSEAHDNGNRAGFSVIAIGSDEKGIELSFWGDEIWAQDDAPSLFTKDLIEAAAFDTTANYVNYDLIVGTAGYELKADGASVLTGTIRDYSAFVPPLFAPDPYETPNYIFLGDNTTSARADTSITRVAVAVPEPGAVGLAGLVGAWMMRRGATLSRVFVQRTAKTQATAVRSGVRLRLGPDATCWIGKLLNYRPPTSVSDVCRWLKFPICCVA